MKDVKEFVMKTMALGIALGFGLYTTKVIAEVGYEIVDGILGKDEIEEKEKTIPEIPDKEGVSN